MHSSTIVIGQKLGQDSNFRERFDVAVARAVAEMKVLGDYHMLTSYIEIIFVYPRLQALVLLIRVILVSFVFQLNTAFLLFMLVACL